MAISPFRERTWWRQGRRVEHGLKSSASSADNSHEVTARQPDAQQEVQSSQHTNFKDSRSVLVDKKRVAHAERCNAYISHDATSPRVKRVLTLLLLGRDPLETVVVLP